MATTIITKNGSGAPADGDLNVGELAVDLTNKQLYTKNSDGVIKLGGSGNSGEWEVNGDDIYYDTGNVGIGTSDPSHPLHIKSGSTSAGSVETNNQFKITTGDAASYGAFFSWGKKNGDDTYYALSIDGLTNNIGSDILLAPSGGNVGIGTEPFAPLHVKVTEGSAGETDPFVRFERFTAGNNHYLDITLDNSTNMVGFESTGTSDGGFTFGGASSDLLTITSQGRVGVGVSDPDEKLEVAGDIKINTGGGAGVLHFGETSDECKITGRDSSHATKADVMDFFTDGVQRMRIDANGNVGIGTGNQTPSEAGLVVDAKGEVNTSASAAFKSNVDTYLRIARFGTGGDSSITLGNNYSRNGGDFSADDSSYPVHNLSFSSDGSIRFGTGAAGESIPTERMRIDSGGDVGIGISDPLYPLHVSRNTGGSPQIAINAGTANSDGVLGFLLSGTSVGSIVANKPLTFHTNTTSNTSNERMRLDASGNLLIGQSTESLSSLGTALQNGGRIVTTTENEVALVLNRKNAGTPNIIHFYADTVNAGYIRSTGGGTPSFASASDIRLKDNVTDHESELSNVMSLRPVRWDWKEECRGSGEGFIAQELEKTAWSDLVTEGEDGYKEVGGLGVVETRLIKAIQEQQAMIETLQAQVAELQGA